MRAPRVGHARAAFGTWCAVARRTDRSLNSSATVIASGDDALRSESTPWTAQAKDEPPVDSSGPDKEEVPTDYSAGEAKTHNGTPQAAAQEMCDSISSDSGYSDSSSEEDEEEEEVKDEATSVEAPPTKVPRTEKESGTEQTTAPGEEKRSETQEAHEAAHAETQCKERHCGLRRHGIGHPSGDPAR